jgi:prepilin-type N-terminal cleavage/methylation domain-containing protein/prepilin-type processing-associated H-X9-DG protein
VIDSSPQDRDPARRLAASWRRTGVVSRRMVAPVPLRRAGRGMTLVELLVVCAVIAGLMAVLLPAAQSAREAARRVSCLNNLRHVGCALHGHLLSRRAFPVGCTEWRAPGKTGAERCLAWSSRILPWLEEQAVADRIDFGKPFDHAANAAAAATPLAIFRCPSADRTELLVAGMGRSDYGGVTGERITSPNNPEKGGLIHDRGFGQREIPDGLSRTVLVGECAAGPWSDGQWINGRNLFDQAYAVNWPTWEDELRSRHPGGGHALFGDGAVRLLGDTLDPRVLAAVCTRAGGEAVSDSGAAP